MRQAALPRPNPPRVGSSGQPETTALGQARLPQGKRGRRTCGYLAWLGVNCFEFKAGKPPLQALGEEGRREDAWAVFQAGYREVILGWCSVAASTEIQPRT